MTDATPQTDLVHVPATSERRHAFIQPWLSSPKKETNHGNKVRKLPQAGLPEGHGFVGERYAYSAYGTPVFMTGAGVVQTSSTIGFETLYAGYCFDGTTPQMYYVRNRFLQPMIGTWNRRDPLGNVGRMNLYGLSRAISATDPSGLQEVSVTFSPAAANQITNVYFMRLPQVMKNGKWFTTCGTVKKCVSLTTRLKDCKARDKKGVMLQIDVHIEFVIINPDCSDHDDWRRTLGHKPRHIRNETAIYQQSFDLLKQEIEKYYTDHPESHVNRCTPCKNATERKEIRKKVDKEFKVWQENFEDNYVQLFEKSGGPHPSNARGGPEAGEPYDPLEGTNVAEITQTSVLHSIKNTVIPKGTSPCARGELKELGAELDDQAFEALRNAGGGFLID